MGKCLITRLAGVVNNEDLRKVGEMRVHFSAGEEKTESRKVQLSILEPITLKIEGGYFTDSKFTQNLGTSLEFSNIGKANNTYVSNTNCTVSVSNKYAVAVFRLGDDCDIDISEFAYTTNAREIYFNKGKNLKGDVASLKNCYNAEHIWIAGSEEIFGDISSLANLRKIKILTLANNPKMTGNIASLAPLTPTLKTLNLYRTAIYGDITFLKDSDIRSFSAEGCQNITGDLSLLKNTVMVKSSGDGNKFSWKNERPSDKVVMALIGIDLGDGVDAMLINQAKCQKIESDNVWDRTISVIGNRTSSSDDAIATLQSKGYTVVVI